MEDMYNFPSNTTEHPPARGAGNGGRTSQVSLFVSYAKASSVVAVGKNVVYPPTRYIMPVMGWCDDVVPA